MQGPQRQGELYLGGMTGARCPIPLDPDALATAAQAVLPAENFAYCAGGAGMQRTLAANRAALDGIAIRPRMLRDVAERSLATTVLGQAMASPLLLAPVGVQSLAHPDADLATARAGAREGVAMIFSNQASVPMEETAAAMGDATRWFQLYWSRSEALVQSLVGRAEACGCTAIVVTLDTTMLGWRTRDLDLAYLPFMRGLGIAQYSSDPVFRSLLERSPEDDPMAAARLFMDIYSNPAIDWGIVARLRKMTPLPIVLKGITHPEDARLALEHGVDGIVVSNHGGRQVDGAIGAATVLAEVAPLVKGRMALLFDSGIRSGADMFKALALGADAVLIGRPLFYALAVAGEAGVRALLRNLIAELDLTMGLAGCRSVDDIGPECVG
jgi:lactate 2-monooxygenase